MPVSGQCVRRFPLPEHMHELDTVSFDTHGILMMENHTVGSEGVAWAQLPDEVIERTCSFLGRADLLRFQRVDRRAQRIVQQSGSQLVIALETSGYVINPSCSTPTEDASATANPLAEGPLSTHPRTLSLSPNLILATLEGDELEHPPWNTPTTAASVLHNLRAKEKAWRELRPRVIDPGVSVVGRTQIYELQCGIFVWAERYESTIAGERAFPHNLRLIPLPAALPETVPDHPSVERPSQPYRLGMPSGGLDQDEDMDDGNGSPTSTSSTSSISSFVTAASTHSLSGLEGVADLAEPMDVDAAEEIDDVEGAAGSLEIHVHSTAQTTITPPPASPTSGPSSGRFQEETKEPKLSIHQSYASKLPLESRDVGYRIADLTLDPTQDLVVLSQHLDVQDQTANPAFEIEINAYHLMSLSTLKPHALAKFPILTWPLPAPTARSSGQLLQILGNILAVLVIAWNAVGDPVHQAVRIWDWRKGILLVDHILPYSPCAASFALITPNEYLITTAAGPIEGDELTAAIQVYHFDHKLGPALLCQPRFMAAFNLPALCPNVILDGVDVRPDPSFPPRNSGSFEPTGLYQPRSVVEDYMKGVFVFAIQALHQQEAGGQVEDDWTDLLLFVQKETLLELARKVDRETPGPPPFTMPLASWANGALLDTDVLTPRWRVVEWEQWGPENSRLVQNTSDNSRQWVCVISGYRYVTSIRDRRPEHLHPDNPNFVLPRQGPHHIKVLDFNPFSIARHTSAGTSLDNPADSPCTATLRVEPTTILKTNIFKKDITTSLPYLEVQTKDVHAFDGVMMDADRVMLIKCAATRSGDIAQNFETWAF